MQYKEDISNAVKVLREGGTILYPTDTIWGIGCDATNSDSVRGVFEIKGRSDNKSLLVLVNSITMLERYVKEVPGIAVELIEVSVSPLTIIFKGARNLAPELVADDGSVGIRVVDEPFCADLLDRFGKPIVSTSANQSGVRSPGNYSEVREEIRDAVDYNVGWRQDELEKGTASSIIKLGPGGEFVILR